MPITSYLVKDGPLEFNFGGKLKETAFNYRSRNPRATIWLVERESPEEAAVRRMNWIEDRIARVGILVFVPALETASGMTVCEHIDKSCPPPAPKETQLDWNTGEPIRAVKTWQESSGVWIACVSDSSPERLYCSCLVSGKLAVGDSREAAIANLKAIQQAIKS